MIKVNKSKKSDDSWASPTTATSSSPPKIPALHAVLWNWNRNALRIRIWIRIWHKMNWQKSTNQKNQMTAERHPTSSSPPKIPALHAVLWNWNRNALRIRIWIWIRIWHKMNWQKSTNQKNQMTAERHPPALLRLKYQPYTQCWGTGTGMHSGSGIGSGSGIKWIDKSHQILKIRWQLSLTHQLFST